MSKITYENKVALSEKPEIDDINKVKATDMNEIKQVVNQNDDNVGNLQYLETLDKTSLVNAINEIITQNSYSLEETFTGEHWIDGKPIYRKVINCGALPNNAIKTLSTGISNVDFYTNIMGISKRPSDNNFFPLNVGRPSRTISSCALWISSNNEISIETDSDRTNFTVTYVVLEYTKTTD